MFLSNKTMSIITILVLKQTLDKGFISQCFTQKLFQVKSHI